MPDPIPLRGLIVRPDGEGSGTEGFAVWRGTDDAGVSLLSGDPPPPPPVPTPAYGTHPDRPQFYQQRLPRCRAGKKGGKDVST